MPIAGSYRSIDFALSNMTNSHIKKVAVFTQYNSRSLNEHLNSSKWWDFGRKQGGLFVVHADHYGNTEQRLVPGNRGFHLSESEFLKEQP